MSFIISVIMFFMSNRRPRPRVPFFFFCTFFTSCLLGGPIATVEAAGSPSLNDILTPTLSEVLPGGLSTVHLYSAWDASSDDTASEDGWEPHYTANNEYDEDMDPTTRECNTDTYFSHADIDSDDEADGWEPHASAYVHPYKYNYHDVGDGSSSSSCNSNTAIHTQSSCGCWESSRPNTPHTTSPRGSTKRKWTDQEWLDYEESTNIIDHDLICLPETDPLSHGALWTPSMFTLRRMDLSAEWESPRPSSTLDRRHMRRRYEYDVIFAPLPNGASCLDCPSAPSSRRGDGWSSPTDTHCRCPQCPSFRNPPPTGRCIVCWKLGHFSGSCPDIHPSLPITKPSLPRRT